MPKTPREMQILDNLHGYASVFIGIATEMGNSGVRPEMLLESMGLAHAQMISESRNIGMSEAEMEKHIEQFGKNARAIVAKDMATGWRMDEKTQ